VQRGHRGEPPDPGMCLQGLRWPDPLPVPHQLAQLVEADQGVWGERYLLLLEEIRMRNMQAVLSLHIQVTGETVPTR
jgi:hypothetical protein